VTAARAVVLARCTSIVLAAVIVQVSVAASFGLLGVRPELTLLLAVAAGVSAGPDRGAKIGFALGLAYDLFLQTPLGLTALVYSLVAYGAGAVQGQMAGTRRGSRMLLVGGGTAVGVLALVLVGRLLDALAPPVVTTIRVALVAGLVNAVAGLAATRVWSWAFAPETPARARI
jgi:rod shape-determining protein MreD